MRRALAGLVAGLCIPTAVWGQSNLVPCHDEHVTVQEGASQQAGVVEGDGRPAPAGAGVAALPTVEPASAFDWIKGLAGEWEGTFEWSGGRSDRGVMSARYYLTGNGSAAVEDLIMDGKPVMTSVYHLDGPALRMTHYCAAGNQPRLKASAIDEGKRSIRFELVDVTNLKSPSAGHVHNVELRVLDENRITVTFTFKGSGAASYELVQLTRL